MKVILPILISIIFLGCGGGAGTNSSNSSSGGIAKIPTSGVNTPKSLKN